MKKIPFQQLLDDLNAFWSGNKPSSIPYTFYGWFHKDEIYTDPSSRLSHVCEHGFIPVRHIIPYKTVRKNLTERIEKYEENGTQITRINWETPVGNVWCTCAEGWNKDFWLKTPEDYKVMTYIMENTVVEPDPESYYQIKKTALSIQMAPMLFIERTPYQHIIVDYAGLEMYALQVADMEEEMIDLYHAIERNFAQRIEIAAEIDPDVQYVTVLENYTADQSGPKRFDKFLKPIYEKYFPTLQKAGKVVGTHYDGKTKGCRDLIAKSPMDLIESLTCQPEGDQSLAEARAIWPDKLFWVNINLENYGLPDQQLSQRVHEMIDEASVKGKQLAFEISEDWPANAFDKIPVVLDAIQEHTF